MRGSLTLVPIAFVDVNMSTYKELGLVNLHRGRDQGGGGQKGCVAPLQDIGTRGGQAHTGPKPRRYDFVSDSMVFGSKDTFICSAIGLILP